MAEASASAGPRPGVEYRLQLGTSLTRPSSNPVGSVCGLRYDFKPASVSSSKQGVLEMHTDNRVSLYLPNRSAGGALDVVLSGKVEGARDQLDCVAVFENGAFTLELLGGTLNTRHIRDAAPYAGPGPGAAPAPAARLLPKPDEDDLFGSPTPSLTPSLTAAKAPTPNNRNTTPVTAAATARHTPLQAATKPSPQNNAAQAKASPKSNAPASKPPPGTLGAAATKGTLNAPGPSGKGASTASAAGFGAAASKKRSGPEGAAAPPSKLSRDSTKQGSWRDAAPVSSSQQLAMAKPAPAARPTAAAAPAPAHVSSASPPEASVSGDDDEGDPDLASALDAEFDFGDGDDDEAGQGGQAALQRAPSGSRALQGHAGPSSTAAPVPMPAPVPVSQAYVGGGDSDDGEGDDEYVARCSDDDDDGGGIEYF